MRHVLRISQKGRFYPDHLDHPVKILSQVLSMKIEKYSFHEIVAGLTRSLYSKTIVFMKNKLALYLAGSIQKGHEKSDTSWVESDLIDLQKNLSEYDLSFLNPAVRFDDLSDQRSVFGRDMLQVYCSDVVFVDAREKRGLGVGAEMMWAKVRKIPVVTLAPKNTHYVKDKTTLLGVSVTNWVHPFVESLSDAIVENLDEGCEQIRKLMQGKIPVKGIEYIELSMQHYKATQFHIDHPMKDLINGCGILKQRIGSL